MSEWADRTRILSPEASAAPGPWRTSAAPYQRGWMDAVSDPRFDTIVLMTSSQVGKTDAVVCNPVGFHIDQDPAPMLVMMPTLEMGESWSSDRLAPMLRDTPALRAKTGDPKSRDSGATKLHKNFPGGTLDIVGANSPSSLASRPKAKIFCDEVDRYPVSAGTEGDPVALVWKRAATFWNRTRVLTSTPTVKGASRIESLYLETDQRVYHIPCPHCHTPQRLVWENVRWENDDPESAYYACPHCAGVIRDSEKVRALSSGEWVATAKSKNRRWIGFHISELYSPWRRWRDIVADFLEARRAGPEALRAWTNTSLGETVDDGLTSELTAEYLQNRGLDYQPGSVFEEGLLLTAGVDTQDDRLAVVVRAWGAGESSWLVWHGEIFGDPARPELWAALDELLDKGFQHPTLGTIPVTMAAVDSGGHHTQTVYAYCRGRPDRMAIKGAGGDRPIIAPPRKIDLKKDGKVLNKSVKLWILGVDAAKRTIVHRLQLAAGTPGALAFYADVGFDYLEQLTAEVLVVEFRKGVPVSRWKKLRPRNESLDCEVYALAAALAAGLSRTNWVNLKARLEKRINQPVPVAQPVNLLAEPPAPAPVKKTVIKKGGWRARM